LYFYYFFQIKIFFFEKAIISSSRREGSVRDPDEHEKMLRLFVVIPKHMTKDDLRKVFEVIYFK
jgi:hypothetical protein